MLVTGSGKIDDLHEYDNSYKVENISLNWAKSFS